MLCFWFGKTKSTIQFSDPIPQPLHFLTRLFFRHLKTQPLEVGSGSIFGTLFTIIFYPATNWQTDNWQIQVKRVSWVGQSTKVGCPSCSHIYVFQGLENVFPHLTTTKKTYFLDWPLEVGPGRGCHHHLAIGLAIMIGSVKEREKLDFPSLLLLVKKNGQTNI